MDCAQALQGIVRLACEASQQAEADGQAALAADTPQVRTSIACRVQT